MSLRIIILAAGKGKRMKSDHPKVLHEILGTPMISYVLDSAGGVKNDGISVVIGDEKDSVRSSLDGNNVEIIVQNEQLGTGHAVKIAAQKTGRFKGSFLILNGDLPAVTQKTLKEFVKKHDTNGSVFSFISADLAEPAGYGRVVRNGSGELVKIVEEKDATQNEKQITEINSGAYCIDADFLKKNISKLGSNNRQREYYLPELLNLAHNDNKKTFAYRINDHTEILGVNRRKELAAVQKIIKDRINERHMDRGVTMIDPESTYISPEAVIGKDTVIHPNTYIYGDSRIGSSCSIGPSSYILNSRIGRNCDIRFATYITDARIRDDVSVGPFAHIRPETDIMQDAKIGNFVEIKKSRVGKKSKVPHLSYIGDATLGENVNIGAGSITCNYDGVKKYQTIIGDGAFIGSDTMMVAPLRIGKDATTAAGSTITRNVKKGSLAIERSKQKEIENWNKRPSKKKGK